MVPKMQAPTKARRTKTVGARSLRAQCRVNTEGLARTAHCKGIATPPVPRLRAFHWREILRTHPEWLTYYNRMRCQLEGCPYSVLGFQKKNPRQAWRGCRKESPYPETVSDLVGKISGVS